LKLFFLGETKVISDFSISNEREFKMSTSSASKVENHINAFKKRIDEHIKNEPNSALLTSRELRWFLERSIIYLRENPHESANEIASLLMGKANQLPELVQQAGARIPAEIKKILNDLLRTNRYGVTNEAQKKTASKLNYLLGKLDEYQSVQTTAPATKPVNEKTGMPKSSSQQPPILQHTAQKPISQQPTAQIPAIQQPAAQKPITQKPVAQKPAIQQPTAQQSKIEKQPDGVATISPALNPKYRQFTEHEIHGWLFNQNQDLSDELPPSELYGRNKAAQAHSATFDSVQMIGTGKYSSRIGIFNGSITGLKANDNQSAAIGDSNNGDLLTGCGYAVAKAVINAAGAGLQTELYNKYGVPKDEKGRPVTEEPTDYGKQHYAHYEGRGYSLTCGSYDMQTSHGITAIELLTVPMYSEAGVVNMYLEALIHSKDKDFIALPLAGMTHPVIDGDSAKSARLSIAAVKKFYDTYPDSKLKTVFTIFNDPRAIAHYTSAVTALEKS
jgi:hypothetical protein